MREICGTGIPSQFLFVQAFLQLRRQLIREYVHIPAQVIWFFFLSPLSFFLSAFLNSFLSFLTSEKIKVQYSPGTDKENRERREGGKGQRAKYRVGEEDKYVREKDNKEKIFLWNKEK